MTMYMSLTSELTFLSPLFVNSFLGPLPPGPHFHPLRQASPPGISKCLDPPPFTLLHSNVHTFQILCFLVPVLFQERHEPLSICDSVMPRNGLGAVRGKVITIAIRIKQARSSILTKAKVRDFFILVLQKIF